MIEDVEVRDAGRKGRGVFAKRDFARGDFIFRRRNGRVIRNTQLRSLSAEERRHLTELDYERSAVVLPPGAYLNHSCEPNAMRSGVKVFAWRRIRMGEEITIDYRLNAFGGTAQNSLAVSLRDAELHRRHRRRLFRSLTRAAARVPSIRAGVHPPRISTARGRSGRETRARASRSAGRSPPRSAQADR